MVSALFSKFIYFSFLNFKFNLINYILFKLCYHYFVEPALYRNIFLTVNGKILPSNMTSGAVSETFLYSKHLMLAIIHGVVAKL